MWRRGVLRDCMSLGRMRSRAATRMANLSAHRMTSASMAMRTTFWDKILQIQLWTESVQQARLRADGWQNFNSVGANSASEVQLPTCYTRKIVEPGDIRQPQKKTMEASAMHPPSTECAWHHLVRHHCFFATHSTTTIRIQNFTFPSYSARCPCSSLTLSYSVSQRYSYSQLLIPSYICSRPLLCTPAPANSAWFIEG